MATVNSTIVSVLWWVLNRPNLPQPIPSYKYARHSVPLALCLLEFGANKIVFEPRLWLANVSFGVFQFALIMIYQNVTGDILYALIAGIDLPL